MKFKKWNAEYGGNGLSNVQYNNQLPSKLFLWWITKLPKLTSQDFVKCFENKYVIEIQIVIEKKF